MARGDAAIVAAARRCIGVRFRLHGRSPATGLDCVGLAAFALGIADVPAGYALRGVGVEAISERLAAAGLRRVGDGGRAGDLLLLRVDPRQAHLAIRTERGFVHADAGLSCVAEVPGEPRWPILGAWRAD